MVVGNDRIACHRHWVEEEGVCAGEVVVRHHHRSEEVLGGDHMVCADQGTAKEVVLDGAEEMVAGDYTA